MADDAVAVAKGAWKATSRADWAALALLLHADATGAPGEPSCRDRVLQRADK